MSKVDITTDAHWDLLEANLAVALKLYAQGVEKARYEPVYGTTLNNVPLSYDADVNALEQALQETNSQLWQKSTVATWTTHWWFWETTHWSSPLYGALLNDAHAELPEEIDFQTLAGIVPGSNFKAGSQSLDSVFFQNYLRTAVAYTMVGWMVRAEQVRQGTALSSPRVAGWGYEPDFYRAGESKLSMLKRWKPERKSRRATCF